MNTLKRFTVTTPSDRLDALLPFDSDRGVFLGARCLAEASNALNVELKIILGSGANHELAICPIFITSENTFFRFHPGSLLARLMCRCERFDLQAALMPSIGRRCLVAAIPLAYSSPFAAIEDRDVDAVCEQLELSAAAAGVSDCAVLNLSGNDSGAMNALRDRGFRVARLDSLAVIPIDPGWNTMEDYSRSLGARRGKKVQNERKKFLAGHFECKWHDRLSAPIIDRAVVLEGLTIVNDPCRKVEVPGPPGSEWYQFVERGLIDSHRVFVVRDRGGDIVAISVLFLVSGRLIGKANAVDRDLNRKYALHFNTAYYEPIKFALEQKSASYDCGPEGERTKKWRGAVAEPLWGAFKFAEGHPANARWPEIEEALSAQHAKWWSTARPSRPAWG